MTKFTKEIIIESSQQKTWAIIADLGDIYKYNPSVSKSYYTSDKKHGVGASRICELLPAGKVEEVITKWVSGKSTTG
jgi:hypothetical protein